MPFPVTLGNSRPRLQGHDIIQGHIKSKVIQDTAVVTMIGSVYGLCTGVTFCDLE